MKISAQQAALICLGAYAFSLSAGYVLVGAWLSALLTIIVAGIWLWAFYRHIQHLFSPIFIFAALMAIFSLFAEVPAPLAIFSMVAALTTWDLVHFDARLKDSGEDVLLEHQHLRHVALVAGISLVATILASLWRLRLRLGMEMLVALGLVIGLGQLIGLLRGKPKKPDRK